MKKGLSDDHLHHLKDNLDSLKNKIPQVVNLETGKNISTSPSAFDLVLVTDFKNNDDLQAYRIHPAHQDVLKIIKETTDEVIVVDYSY
jgi:hypothetical protein